MLSSVLCDGLEGWRGEEGGPRERGYMYTHSWFTVETNPTLWSNYTPIKKKKAFLWEGAVKKSLFFNLKKLFHFFFLGKFKKTPSWGGMMMKKKLRYTDLHYMRSFSSPCFKAQFTSRLLLGAFLHYSLSQSMNSQYYLRQDCRRGGICGAILWLSLKPPEGKQRHQFKCGAWWGGGCGLWAQRGLPVTGHPWAIPWGCFPHILA